MFVIQEHQIQNHHAYNNKHPTGEAIGERKVFEESSEYAAAAEKEREQSWILVDGIALLILFNYHSNHREEIETVLYSLCRLNIFPFSTLLHITNIIQKPSTDEISCSSKKISREVRESSIKCGSSGISPILIPALIQLGLYLIFTPIRHSNRLSYHRHFFQPAAKRQNDAPTPEEGNHGHVSCFFERYGTHSALSQTHDYIVELYGKLPNEESRVDLISSLVSLSSPTNFIQSLILPLVTKDHNPTPLDYHSLYEMNVPIGNSKKRQRQQVVGRNSPTQFSNTRFSNQQMESIPHRLLRLLHPPQCSSRFKYKLRDVYDAAFASLWIARSIIHSY